MIPEDKRPLLTCSKHPNNHISETTMTIMLIGTWRNMIKREGKKKKSFPNKLKSCLPGNSEYKHRLTGHN